MDGQKNGTSVKELEEFAKKHRFEVFFCLIFIFACFFSSAFYSQWWSVIFITAGGVVGVLTPAKSEAVARKMFNFVFKQEHTTQLVLGIVGLILAIFLPPLVFLMLGVHAGRSIYHMASDASHHR